MEGDAGFGEEMMPEGTSAAYLIFMAGIRPETARSLLTTLSMCANQGVEEVRLLIGTGGGGMDAGVGLFNAMRGLPFRLVTHNIGTVASIGVPVYLAGEERIACPHSHFMLHGATSQVPAQQDFGAKWFREQHDSLLAGEARTNAILADRTNLSDDELAVRSETEQTLDADAAVEHGIAHKIEDVNIPEDAFIYTVPI
jgi:Protease subunit of ATP-dependent Clp proteases